MILKLDESAIDAAEARLRAREIQLHALAESVKASARHSVSGPILAAGTMAATALFGIALGRRRRGATDAPAKKAPSSSGAFLRATLFTLATPWIEKLIAAGLTRIVHSATGSARSKAATATVPAHDPVHPRP